MTALGRAAEVLLLREGDDVAEFGEGHGQGYSLDPPSSSNLPAFLDDWHTGRSAG
jgi:hypothetical protein